MKWYEKDEMADEILNLIFLKWDIEMKNENLFITSKYFEISIVSTDQRDFMNEFIMFISACGNQEPKT